MLKKSLENQSIERRESPRHRLKTKVKLVVGKKETIEESENLSLTGLFLKSNVPENYGVDEPVEVSYTDESGKEQKHTGKIIRKSKTGVAIMYWRDKAPPPIV